MNYVPSEVPDGGLAAIGLSDLNKNVPTVDTLLDAVYHAVVEGVDTWEKCLNTMESSVGPLAPILDDYVAHLNWIGNHVIARSPLEKSWREDYSERSTIMVARTSRRRAGSAHSTSKKHPCAL